MVLKLSGEALAGNEGHGIHTETVNRISNEVKSLHDLGVEVAIVVGGGGNFWRGRSAKEMDRTTSDYMGGMLGTVYKCFSTSGCIGGYWSYNK